jgi:hypothetical protein
MHRSVSVEYSQDNESTRDGVNYDWVTPMAPRRVTADESPSCEGGLKPSLWTPEENGESPIDKTPHQLQSPEFNVQSIEIRALKERVDRQDDILETMLREIMSLRRELSMFRPKTDSEELGKTEDPFHSSSLSHSEVNLNDFNENIRKRCKPIASPGTQFVAEFSKIFELESGQHTLLASILDQSLNGRNKFKHS